MSRILRIGLKGDDVSALQTALNSAISAGLVVDGYFGPATEAVVEKFQASRGLVVDGIVGPITLAAIGLPAPVPVTPVPVTPSHQPVPVYTTLAQIDAHLEKGTAPWYQAAYLIMEFDKGYESYVKEMANKVLAHKSLYLPVEQATGIPWVVIGLIHAMECGNNPKGVLHNGEAIIGTGRKTTLVPAGRGPFATFLASALDAIKIQSIWHVPNWTVGYILKQCELFNGTGYLLYHHAENSPYDWACTNINDGHGKYVSDGKWDPNADTHTQVGAAAILRELELMGETTVLYA